MKILVLSDSHRQEKNLFLALEKEKPDLLIHLGDSEGAENKIENMVDCDLLMVAGNNDFFSKLADEKEVVLSKTRALLTHGHTYGVSLGVENIKMEAKSRNCKIVMFGHTHKPYYENKDNIIVLNPGSISYPRQTGRKPSYAVINIDKNENIDVEIKYIEDEF